VVAEFTETLKAYKISRVYGDRYAGEWPREQFRKRAIDYRISEKSKSELYSAFLPLINSGKIELLDNPRLIAQLCSLERRTGRGTGRDSIDHPSGAGWHDDIANSVCGACVMAATGPRLFVPSERAMRWASMPGSGRTAVANPSVWWG